MAWASDLAAATRPRWHALDVFGASQKVTTTWIREGMAATAFDIKITRKHDICTSEGCKELIRMGVQLFSDGVALAAPPCSLYGPACSSVHKRSRTNVRGDLSNFKVRLARRIWNNFVECMRVIHRVRGHLWLLVEQPSGSWAYQQPEFEELIKLLKLICVCTWMGLFSHDLPKCTHLMTNIREMTAMKRILHPKDRQRIKARFQRRQAKRKCQRDYHKRITSASGKPGWQGGRHLPLSAVWTRQFCLALMQCWLKACILRRTIEE